MPAEENIKAGEGIAPLSAAGPRPAVAELHRRSRREIRDILGALQQDAAGWRGFKVRAGLLDPLNSVVSERIRDFCRLSYRTTEGTIAACPGILDAWKACPPRSPAVSETRDLLTGALGFLIVQFEGKESLTKQSDAHAGIARTADALRKNGFPVIETYACGPCRVCPRGCGRGEECRQPKKRLFALESCGFWVNALCRKAAEFPVLAGGPREVRWIRDWALPGQDTETVRYVTAILLGPDSAPPSTTE